MTRLVVSGNNKFVTKGGSFLGRVENVPLFFEVLPDGEITGYNPPGSGEIVIPTPINEITILTIGDGAFTGSNFTTVTLPDTLTGIGNNAFDGSTITRITIPDNVTLTSTSLGTLGDSFKTFYDNNSKKRGTYVYYNSSWVDIKTFFVFDEPTNTITGYNVAGGLNVIIPVSINEVPVLHIGNSAFSLKGLTSLTISEGITSIGEMAFQNNQLATINLPDTLSTIGFAAFSGNLLTNITIPNSVWDINSMAFNANPLTTIVLPGWLEIGNDVMGDYCVEFARDYYNYSQASGVYTFADGYWTKATTLITELEFWVDQPVATNVPQTEPWLMTSQYTATMTWEPNDAVFELGLDYVATITLIPNMGYTFIGLPENCFTVNYGNTRVATTNPANAGVITATFPKTTYFSFEPSTNTITGYATNAPKVVAIPAHINDISVSVIGGWSFIGKGITSVSGLNNIEEIGGGAFAGNLLSSISLPNLTTIHSESFAGNRLTSANIPHSVKYIHGYAFSDNLIQSLNLNIGLEEIGYGAFYGNSLTSVSIPQGVQRIDESAFGGNPITSVTIGSGVTFSGSSVFGEYYNSSFRDEYLVGQAGTYVYNMGTGFWSRV